MNGLMKAAGRLLLLACAAPYALILLGLLWLLVAIISGIDVMPVPD